MKKLTKTDGRQYRSLREKLYKAMSTLSAHKGADIYTNVVRSSGYNALADVPSDQYERLLKIAEAAMIVPFVERTRTVFVPALPYLTFFNLLKLVAALPLLPFVAVMFKAPRGSRVFNAAAAVWRVVMNNKFSPFKHVTKD